MGDHKIGLWSSGPFEKGEGEQSEEVKEDNTKEKEKRATGECTPSHRPKALIYWEMSKKEFDGGICGPSFWGKNFWQFQEKGGRKSTGINWGV